MTPEIQTASIEQSMGTRLGVLEHKVATLSSDLHAWRKETREGFEGLRAHLDDLLKREAERPRTVNWQAVLTAIAVTVAVISSIFGLAEWRIATAMGPVHSHIERTEKTLTEMDRTIDQLQIDFARRGYSDSR